MISFDIKNKRYTVTFNGTAEDYIGRLRAVIRLLLVVDKEQLDPETKHHAATLVDELFPAPEQNIDINTK